MKGNINFEDKTKGANPQGTAEEQPPLADAVSPVITNTN